MNKETYTDYTLKVRVEDVEGTKRVLIKLGADYKGVDQQVDRYYKVPSGKLKWRKGNIENLITHYERVETNEIEQTIVYRYDTNPSDDAIDRLISEHEFIGEVYKERHIFTLPNIKIHIDKLPNGQKFLEIEAFTKDPNYEVANLASIALELLCQLGFTKQEILKTGYLKL